MQLPVNNKIFFFDRDGIVNRRLPDDYVKNWGEFKFLPFFFELFKIVKQKGYLTALVTNQQGVAKALMTEENLTLIHQKMQEELKKETTHNFDYLLYSTDLDRVESIRRKPALGMFLEVLSSIEGKSGKLTNKDLENSFMLGDSLTDLVPANMLNIKTIFIGKKVEFEEQIQKKEHKIIEIIQYNLEYFKTNKFIDSLDKLDKTNNGANFSKYFTYNYQFENLNELLVSKIF